MHSLAQSPRSARTSAVLALLTIAALLVSLLAITRPALADAPGNNGTVKIHEGATEEEPIVANDPHVCTFHLHFFFGDDVQAGNWWIEEWSPGDQGSVVLTGSYNAVSGEDRQPEQGVYELPNGHYKLFWEGATNPGGQTEIKHKVFWVACEGGEEGQASLSLTKVDQNDDPIAGVSFTLTSTSNASVTFTDETDANGALSFTGLAADTYVLSEVAPQGCTGIADVTLTLAADGTVTFEGEHAGVTLDEDGDLVVENSCGPGGSGGQLLALGLTKVDQDDNPLDGVSFMLTSTSDLSASFMATTDASGTLTFTGLAADSYILSETALQGCTGIADVTLTLAADGTVTFDGEHAGVTLDQNGNLVVENTCGAGGSGEAGLGQIMVMKHVCPAGLTPDEFDQIATFAEKVFTCPVVTLPGDEADANARDAGDLADSPFPNGTTDFDFSLEAGASSSTLADATFAPAPVDCPASGDCIETSNYVFSDVARGTVTVTETTPPENYVFGRVLFTPGSGDDATLTSVDSDTGTIVLDTTNDDSVMLHVYNFTGEGAVSPGTGTPAPTEAAPHAPSGSVAPESGVKGSTGVPNTALPDPSGGLLLMILAALVLTGSTVGFAVVNVRDLRRRRR